MTNIFRDYDQAGLDAEYNNRLKVPESPDMLRAGAGRSAKARTEIPGRLNVSFGPDAEETLDIFLATTAAAPIANSGTAPIQVFIHGGYWRMLSQKESSLMADNMVANDAAFATLNYSLAPAASLDEIVRQCRAALAWIYNNAEKYGVDRNRIHVGGSSAGGHLVGMMLAGGWHGEFGVPDDLIKSACALSGLHDMEPIRLSEVNEWLQLDEASARRNSPIHNLPSRGCPLIVAYGGNETSEFKRQSNIYADAWKSAGFECENFEMPNHNHFDIPFDINEPDGILAKAVLRKMF